MVLAADFNIVVDDILAVSDDVEPLWRIDEVQVGNLTSLETIYCEENGSNTLPGPSTAVAIQTASTVDVDIATTNLEERHSLLECVLEGVGTPVC